jgi:hypothetical protein
MGERRTYTRRFMGLPIANPGSRRPRLDERLDVDETSVWGGGEEAT